MGDVLTIAGACKRFGDTEALAGVELRLGSGEWLGLLGPNGAGKTTLVRAICGRVRLDAGSIALLGTTLNGTAPETVAARKRLGVVPQEIAIYPLLTARENLIVFGKLHGLPGARVKQRVDWALEWTGLASRANEPIKNFSGGMKRRLNIACGVLHEPEVVLLDEPTAGVDPQSRQRIWEMLAGLREAGASLLLTTHQLDEAERVCERIVIIDRGKAIADGTLAELVDRTVGRQRRVVLTLSDGREEAFEVTDVAGELAGRLEAVQRSGARVEDLHVEAPTLHAVFLHLTGRELRE